MDFKATNAQYWASLPAAEIIGDNAFPGPELLDLLQPGAAILDIGCGRGVLAQALQKQGYRVTAIDLNKEAIRQGQERNDGVDYLVADWTERLPFEDATFDAITVSFVLVNLDGTDRQKAAQEIHRVLKPGGYAWINEGMTSGDYALRYALAVPYTKEDRTFFVLKEKSASSVTTPEALVQVIQENGVARFAHHFTEEEVRELFSAFQCISALHAMTASPRTGSKIEMGMFVFQK